MCSFSLGALPGKSMAEAADVVASETSLYTVPILPQRGLGNDPIAATVALMPELPIEKGPRSWRLSTRPQLLTRRIWDQRERDLDVLEEVWGANNQAELQYSVIGPLSLATALELPNGHRAVTDRGAVKDISQCFSHAVAANAHTLNSRYGTEPEGKIDVIIAEPALGALSKGNVPGTTQFEQIAPIEEKKLAEVLYDVFSQIRRDRKNTFLRLSFADALPELRIAELAAPDGLIISPEKCQSTTLKDQLAAVISAALPLTLASITPEYVLNSAEKPIPSARNYAINMAKLWDELGFSREELLTVEVCPISGQEKGSLMAAAQTLATATQVEDIIHRDAGDL